MNCSRAAFHCFSDLLWIEELKLEGFLCYNAPSQKTFQSTFNIFPTMPINKQEVKKSNKCLLGNAHSPRNSGRCRVGIRSKSQSSTRLIIIMTLFSLLCCSQPCGQSALFSFSLAAPRIAPNHQNILDSLQNIFKTQETFFFGFVIKFYHES